MGSPEMTRKFSQPLDRLDLGRSFEEDIVIIRIQS